MTVKTEFHSLPGFLAEISPTVALDQQASGIVWGVSPKTPNGERPHDLAGQRNVR